MSEVVNISKVQEAAIKVQEAAKNVAEAAKDNKKTIGIVAGITAGVTLVGVTAYVVAKMTRPVFIQVQRECDESCEGCSCGNK